MRHFNKYYAGQYPNVQSAGFISNAISQNTSRQRKPIGSDLHITLPLPPLGSNDEKFNMNVYAKFMSHLRNIPHNDPQLRILSAIQFTADMLDSSEALISKILVDLGLRAPQDAFPTSFLLFVNENVHQTHWHTDRPPESIYALRMHWEEHRT